MKVVAFNGSPRKKGNTEILISVVLEELQKEEIETEILQLGGKEIKGCLACRKCTETQNNECAIKKNDVLNHYYQTKKAADGIIIGSPTYFANVTSEVKALIDRAGMVSMANGYSLKRKVGAAVVANNRSGATDAFDAINKLFFINQVIVPGSNYWNLGIGLNKGDVKNDTQGIHTIKELGINMAWLMKKIN